MDPDPTEMTRILIKRIGSKTKISNLKKISWKGSVSGHTAIRSSWLSCNSDENLLVGVKKRF